jgi:hypothetical protein
VRVAPVDPLEDAPEAGSGTVGFDTVEGTVA